MNVNFCQCFNLFHCFSSLLFNSFHFPVRFFLSCGKTHLYIKASYRSLPFNRSHFHPLYLFSFSHPQFRYHSSKLKFIRLYRSIVFHRGWFTGSELGTPFSCWQNVVRWTKKKHVENEKACYCFEPKFL